MEFNLNDVLKLVFIGIPSGILLSTLICIIGLTIGFIYKLIKNA